MLFHMQVLEDHPDIGLVLLEQLTKTLPVVFNGILGLGMN